MFSTIKSIFNNKSKELELKEKELALKEKELELKDKEINLKKESLDSSETVKELKEKEFEEKVQSKEEKYKKKFEETKKEPVKKPKREYTPEQKKAYAQEMKERKARGKEFEEFVAGHFKIDGYKILLNGVKNGKKDKGIDIVCTKDEELILIQCKNWKKDGTYKIKHKHLKEFIGNCTVYVNEHNLLDKKVKLKFITSNYVLDTCAEMYLKENKMLQYDVYEYYKE